MISEDRVSDLSHRIFDAIRASRTATFPDEARALQGVKDSVTRFFAAFAEVDEIVRKKLSSYSSAKVPGSRDYEILYRKLYEEEMNKKKW